MIYLSTPDDLYVFWVDMDTDYVMYRKYNGSSWETEVEWIDESTDGIASYNNFTASHVNNRIAIIYVTGTSTYNLRFELLSLGWTNEVMGISVPAKVEGVEGTSISKIVGVE